MDTFMILIKFIVIIFNLIISLNNIYNKIKINYIFIIKFNI